MTDSSSGWETEAEQHLRLQCQIYSELLAGAAASLGQALERIIELEEERARLLDLQARLEARLEELLAAVEDATHDTKTPTKEPPGGGG